MQIKEFDFTTPGDWDTPGDGAIVSNQLTLDDPKINLPWTVHNWSTVPPQDPVTGNRLLQVSTTYRITDDGTPYDLGDYSLVFRLAMLAGGQGSSLQTFHHWTQDVTPTRILTRFDRVTTADLRWFVYHSDSYRRIEDRAYASTTYGWPEGTFREVRMVLRGNIIRLDIPGVRGYMLDNLDMDDTDGGDIAFGLLWGGGKWMLGDGEYGTHASPYICQRKQGGGQLKVASAWDLSSVTALGRMMAVGDLAGGGDLWLPVDLRYNHYNGTSWTGWTAPAADGDISSLSCGSGKKLLVGVTDGSTGGMDTMCDAAFKNHQAEYAPLLDAILVEHTAASTTNIGLRLGGYTGGPNRGEKE